MNAQTDIPKIIGLSGPKEGVGKTIITLNLALLRVSQTARRAIIIDTDPLCRGEALTWLGIKDAPSLKSLHEFYLKAGGGPKAVDLIKGKILFSASGISALPLGFNAVEACKSFRPDTFLSFVRALGNSFDIFIDCEPNPAILPFIMEISDWLYWVIIPQRQALASTIAIFEELKSVNISLSRVDLIVNQFDIPGALKPKDIEGALFMYEKQAQYLLPWEEAIPISANTSFGYIVKEKPSAPWCRSLRFVLQHLTQLKPKSTSSDLSALWQYAKKVDGFWQGDGTASEDGSQAAPAPVASPAKSADELEKSPELQEKFNRLKELVHSEVVVALETHRVKTGGDAAASSALRTKVEQIIAGVLDKKKDIELSRDERIMFIQELVDEIMGLGPLEEILRDESITEIMVNKHNQIFVERKGIPYLWPKHFRNDDQVVEVIKRIVAPLGRRIDESAPLVDARLKDGSRVNAVIPPLAVSGPTLTIRRFSSKPFLGADLIRLGGVTQELLDFMDAAIKIKKNVIVSGGTGSGKTTFLNLMSSYIPKQDRILTIEDVAELRLEQEHWVRLESKPPNIEGKGEVNIRDLVKNALRMRPDRIVVGECRGGEAIDMLQAMNTGHDGSMTTIHSNSPKDALNRLETMCLMSGLNLPVWVLREMVSGAVHVICQLTRLQDGSRKVVSVVEVIGRDENQVLAQEIFKFVQTGINAEGKVQGFHTATGKIPKFFEEFARHGVNIPESIFKPDP
ncbi:ATPase, T2SS/T4P/T4SS family, partial [Elusimicrobiota bacterium]